MVPEVARDRARTSPPSAKRPSSSKEEARPSDDQHPIRPQPGGGRAPRVPSRAPLRRRPPPSSRLRSRPRSRRRPGRPAVAPPAAPKIADPRTEALMAWMEGLLPVGRRRADARRDRRQSGFPAGGSYGATKKYNLDERANDQTYVAPTDSGKIRRSSGTSSSTRIALKAPRAGRGPRRTSTGPPASSCRSSSGGGSRSALDPSLDRRSSGRA